MKRVISLWFPNFRTDRLLLGKSAATREQPLAVIEPDHGRLRLVAVNDVAAQAGLQAGMSLTDARACLPALGVADADPGADARVLQALADACERYTPWVALDGHDGLLLDVTGCAHLYGGGEAGERTLLDTLLAQIRRLGFQPRAALADTPGAAWAMARADLAAGEGRIVVTGGARAALAGLPIAALRLPVETVTTLDRFGLRRIADLYGMATAPMTARCGEIVTRRLDQALGRRDEPVNPRRPVAPYRVRLSLPEPILHLDAVAQAAHRLLTHLCTRLEREERGVRRLELSLHRTDGGAETIGIGTNRPNREPAHLARLLAEHYDALTMGDFGVDVLVLAALETDALAPQQTSLTAQMPDKIIEAETIGEKASPKMGEIGGTDHSDGVAALTDRLANRLGATNVLRMVAHASHVPERSMILQPVSVAPSEPAAKASPWPQQAMPRPIRLLHRPRPVDVMAPLPDDPPALFRWGDHSHKVARAHGPERIAPEWWASHPQDGPQDGAAAIRDYYQLEDPEGRRYWLYRDGPYGGDGKADWYMHGLPY